MNNIDNLTQKIISKFNDGSLLFSNVYLTAMEENNAVIIFDMEGFILKICLDGVKTEYTIPEDRYAPIDVYEIRIDENEGLICFNGLYEDCPKGESELKFDCARSEMMPCRNTGAYNIDCVWSVIIFMATDIYAKYSFDEAFISESERKYLPFVLELMKINDSFDTNLELPVLKAYAEKYGFNKFAASVIKNIGRDKAGLVHKRFSGLDDAEYEPLWRELYMIFYGLCKDYPTISEIIGVESENIPIRKNITDTLHKAGYEGIYPDFRKTGELNDVHLTQSHDTVYFVGCEKNVIYMVHCDEMCSDGEPIITFRSGTIIMKDGYDGNNVDIYSCMFRKGGYRISNSFLCYAENGDVLQAAEIAIKRAELKKLTRDERKAICNDKSFLSFFPTGMLMGFFFGVFFMLGMMIIGFLFEIFLGNSVIEALQLMTDKMWLYTAGVSWLLFGLAMNIVMYMANKK